jgi:SPP1 gp7 family putative phage head morphogenesis protein
LILNDFEELESAFLSFAQKLNKKRQAQLKKRVAKAVDELKVAQEKGNSEEVEGILASLKMPSSKEWYKGLDKLVYSATRAGILRAHFELLRLRELYEFSDDHWEVIPEGYDYDVVIPEEARDFIKKHSYEVGVITEDTVLNRIREELEKGLDNGDSPEMMKNRMNDVTDTWVSEWHAQTIARTETGKFYNAGRLARWTDPETNGFVEALQYDAIVDTRTTDLCEHLDGKIVAITNERAVAEYTPPNHFQCRATWLPVTKYEEWEDDFDTSLKPDKGFHFESPLPKLLKGKKQPIVQPKKKHNPLTITDPDQIRSLDDDDFRLAIGNITDQALKLSMIKERAEQMAVREAGLKELRPDPNFTWYGFNSDAQKGTFELYDELVEFHMTSEIRDDVEELARQIRGVKDSDIEDILHAYEKKHAGSLAHLDIVRAIREARYDVKATKMTWDGAPVVTQTTASKKAYTIKRPPLTKNFRNATGLRQAIDDGEAWMLKHVHPRLHPSTGIKLRFQHDNDRAYATGGTGEIYFGKWENDAGVIVHEAGHVMHWQNKEVADLINTFFKQRTAGDTMSKYHGENTLRDDFFNPYVGRVYGWEERNMQRATGNQFYGQEVLSMGLQEMHTNPQRFYERDKEHFLFTYAIMRGLF